MGYVVVVQVDRDKESAELSSKEFLFIYTRLESSSESKDVSVKRKVHSAVAWPALFEN